MTGGVKSIVFHLCVSPSVTTVCTLVAIICAYTGQCTTGKGPIPSIFYLNGRTSSWHLTRCALFLFISPCTATKQSLGSLFADWLLLWAVVDKKREGEKGNISPLRSLCLSSTPLTPRLLSSVSLCIAEWRSFIRGVICVRQSRCFFKQTNEQREVFMSTTKGTDLQVFPLFLQKSPHYTHQKFDWGLVVKGGVELNILCFSLLVVIMLFDT